MSSVNHITDLDPVKSYLDRIGAEMRSLLVAVVRENKGKYWTDIAKIKFERDGTIHCSSPEHEPTDTERASIIAALARVQLPTLVLLSKISDPPEMVRQADPKDVFEFRTATGDKIIMVQVRIEKDGNKAYIPWTFWSDNSWRIAEPEGLLPLWGMEQLRSHKTAFIHEGAKSASYCRMIAEGATAEARRLRSMHPWSQELIGAAHVGWIGGALSPGRTDWSVLAANGIERAYIVADNDAPGKSAVAQIAKELRIPTFSIEFSGRFRASFDLADPFPPDMFCKIGSGELVYNGPTMRDLMQPATWATDQVPNPSGQGRPLTILRESFGRIWAYVEEIDSFVCTEMPEILRSEAVFNKIVAPFSHVQETSRLLLRQYKGRSAKVCYRPDCSARIVDHRGTNAINLHTPSRIKAVAGDPAPWLEFMEYMFVNEEELRLVQRWCATLIARPGIRIGYGLLLISEAQGIGKTTLGSAILAPLVGYNNVSWPTENDIVSDFNEWVAQKRLAIVNEVYSGSSWRAYHALKSIITDRELTVNQKYMRPYVVDNWCAIIACSNSMRALKMEMDDRRWLYPELTEQPWPANKFSALRHWLHGGGLSIIKSWAENYGEYVREEERAPMTMRKIEMIEGSRSDAQVAAVALAEALLEYPQPAALAMKDIVAWVKHSIGGKMYDTDYEIMRAMTEAKGTRWKERIKINGWMQQVIMNGSLAELCRQAPNPRELLRNHVVQPSTIMGPEL